MATLYVRDCPTVRTMRDHVVNAWSRSTDDERSRGATWYREASDHAHGIAELAGITHTAGAGVIAVLSPQLEWTRNLEEAYRLTTAWLDDDYDALRTFTAYPANVDKASRILAGEAPEHVVSGPKVTAFWHAIAGIDDGPVVDRHATRIATRYRFDAVTRQTYGRVQRAYVNAARRLALDVHTLQASTWLVCKRELNEARA